MTHLADCGRKGEKRMDDLISRQAAIKSTWEEPTYTDPLNVLTEVRDRIEALPSAQAEITEEQVKEYCESRNLVVLTSESYHWLKSLKSKAEEFKWNGGGNY